MAWVACNALGKPHVRILGVQPAFCRKGGGGWIALPNGLWQFFSEYEPLLRNQICIIFHHYLPWLSSEYHLRIMFDHSYCQNVHSQSQNRFNSLNTVWDADFKYFFADNMHHPKMLPNMFAITPKIPVLAFPEEGGFLLFLAFFVVGLFVVTLSLVFFTCGTMCAVVAVVTAVFRESWKLKRTRPQ